MKGTSKQCCYNALIKQPGKQQSSSELAASNDKHKDNERRNVMTDIRTVKGVM